MQWANDINAIGLAALILLIGNSITFGMQIVDRRFPFLAIVSLVCVMFILAGVLDLKGYY